MPIDESDLAREQPADPMTVIRIGGEEYAVWRDMPYGQYLDVRRALNREQRKLREFMTDERVALPETDETE